LWDEKTFEIYTDVLELRRVYVVEADKYFFLSTRLDWISQLAPTRAIDFVRFAGDWNLVFSVADGTFVDGVVRAGPSGHIVITNNTITFSKRHWTPDPAPQEDVVTLLQSAATMVIREGNRLSLGLSGGMDSRTLLALLSDSPKDRWMVHSNGTRSNLDIPLARILARSLSIDHKITYYELQPSMTVESVVHDLREYILQTEMTDSMFEYPRFRIFSDLYKKGFWMIDGGYGEFLRRVYGRKMIFSARRAVEEKNAGVLLPFFSLPKSQIFTGEIHRMFQKETVCQLQQSFDAMPENPEKDLGNWIDLYNIRYQVKNVPANGQAVYDHCIPGYMPYAQPAVMSAYMKLPSDQRRNDHLNRKIISTFNKELSRYPLVRFRTTIPYWSVRNVYASVLWAKAKKKFSRTQSGEHRTFRYDVLQFLRDYILDRVASQSVKTYPYYDYNVIDRSIKEFYQGRIENEQFVEDWLAFDFWRELLAQSHPLP
jgi:hypothetical protein